MKRGRPSGWMLQNRMQRVDVPQMPTKWERFLYKNSIADPIAALRNGKRSVIREWVSRNHDSCYIPLEVLQELGCSTRYD